MRYLVVIGMAVVTAVLIRRKREYTGRILACFGVVMIIMNALYNVRLIDKVLPSIRPRNQAFYQPEYLETGEYPDSLLMQLLKGRTIYVKDDVYYISDAERENKNFMYAYYHAKSMYWFLERAEAAYIKDAAMNDRMVDKEVRDSDFTRLGYTNDMFRYCFMYNDMFEEAGNYFNYYWYYYEFLDPISAYICEAADSRGETVFTSDELVILWQPSAGMKDPDAGEALKPEDEDIYIMTRNYYDTEVCGNE